MIESLKVVRSNNWKPWVALLGRVETAPGTLPPEGTVVGGGFSLDCLEGSAPVAFVALWTAVDG